MNKGSFVFDNRKKKWKAFYKRFNKRKCIGFYHSLDEAKKAYVNAKNKYEKFSEYLID